MRPILIVGVLLVGDERLTDKMRREELVPLGSRMRTPLVLQAHTPAELAECLTHRLRATGNASLMTQGLIHTLCEHALGNPRVLLTTAGELLHAAAQRDLPQVRAGERELHARRQRGVDVDARVVDLCGGGDRGGGVAIAL